MASDNADDFNSQLKREKKKRTKKKIIINKNNVKTIHKNVRTISKKVL